MTDTPYGVRMLPKLYEEWSAGGMIANIGTRAAIAPSPTMKSLRRRQGVNPDRKALETIAFGVSSVTGAELSVGAPSE